MIDKIYMDGTKLDRHLDDVSKWQKGEWFSPIHMELSFTNICNQKCTFCYTAWAHGKTVMDPKVVKDLIISAKKSLSKNCETALSKKSISTSLMDTQMKKGKNYLAIAPQSR